MHVYYMHVCLWWPCVYWCV